ncbi:MAG TPA: TonB-dependent receptor [Bryobacteraceae bacterium]|nr:TonB-dependent receptor [Bryobacteraceae bacterium]
MKASRIVVCALALAVCAFEASAAEVKGMVVDPSGKGIAGAQVAVVGPLGVITRQDTNDLGEFDLYVSPLYENLKVRAAAEGFQTTTVTAGTALIAMPLAAVSESVAVTASAIDATASQQGTEVSVVTSADLRERNEAQAADVLRTLPGMVFAQNGPRGSVTDLFLRGSNANDTVVLLDGVPLNSFYYGGLFDFAHLPSDAIEEIQVARGPQSAIYGSYAVGGAVSIETRNPEDGPALDLVAEGGTHDENHFAISGETMISRGWGIAASLSSLLANGPVPNSDYRDDNALFALDHRWRTQKLSMFGDFTSNEVGEPGAFGSNPEGLYPGIDLVSREKNNTSTYGAHYSNQLGNTLLLDLTAGFFWNNSLYLSPYGPSFNKDLTGNGEARATWNIDKYWTMAAGYVYEREEMRNTFVNTSDGSAFLLRRNDIAEYMENRITIGRLFVNAGYRAERFDTPLVPGDQFGFPPRPDFPARTETKISPKIGAALMMSPTTRLHGSYSTGIRPPGGSDIAFTDNPALRPEQTRSYDAGINHQFLSGKLAVDATWFHNHYQDLIVSLGGSLSLLGQYSTGNLANALTEGIETTMQVRPARWLSLDASYTWLQTEALALSGSSDLVQADYYLGQPLFRRPRNSGTFVASVHEGRVTANLTGYWRSHTLDVEPNYGASEGRFWNPGYQNVGLNVNVRVVHNLTAYANLRNALDQRYEEIYGFPAPLLNVVAGLKWSLARAR